MKKQGFTLIELMVVIVIMGILAAVAVPKLFGMIAKSKASEVPTAAGTWINLQEAYVSENAKLGSWESVGYEAPGTKSNSNSYATGIFSYTGSITSDNDGTSAVTGAWKAVALQGLNDCKTNDEWSLKPSITSKGALKVEDDATDTACKALTASWASLMRN
jgi:prepilin-type N-terminal cleavage/methylation domain-containing protein